jgi:hypothetical protein
MSKQVKCITKRGGHRDPHERIEGIGGGDTTLTRWWRAEADAIRDVEKDQEAYFVKPPSIPLVWVVVAVRNGRKYLKTQPDLYPENNLLKLLDCPPR